MKQALKGAAKTAKCALRWLENDAAGLDGDLLLTFATA